MAVRCGRDFGRNDRGSKCVLSFLRNGVLVHITSLRSFQFKAYVNNSCIFSLTSITLVRLIRVQLGDIDRLLDKGFYLLKLLSILKHVRLLLKVLNLI